MLSRVADCLYWMSRYLERAEHTVRLLDVNLSLMLDRTGTAADHRWPRVLAALGSPPKLTWEGDLTAFTYALALDTSNHFSAAACIVSARENARQVREQISTEQWQKLNRLFLMVTAPSSPDDFDQNISEFLPSVVDELHLFQGVTDTTMSHGEGWQFIQVGRNIERAAATASLVEIYHRDLFSDEAPPQDSSEHLELVGLLRSCTAFEAYCKVYTADLNHERILEFILLNPEFPHSLRYSIDSLQQALQAIYAQTGRQGADELMRLTGRLNAALRFAQISDMLAEDAAAYMRNIVRECLQIHELIYQRYIHYSVQTALAV
jgi:uncharacterized alpha-E superfamily protein